MQTPKTKIGKQNYRKIKKNEFQTKNSSIIATVKPGINVVSIIRDIDVVARNCLTNSSTC
jgi:aspartate carbamoyltransferase regulatory subunit